MLLRNLSVTQLYENIASGRSSILHGANKVLAIGNEYKLR